jgi:uncharacterized Tic20 family protein
MTQSEERNWALAAHIGCLLAAFVAMAFLAPLLVLLVQGDKSAFVRRHAVESLNFQISLLIYLVAGFVLSLVTMGTALVVVVPIGIAVAIAALVFIIAATLAAARGDDYVYPLTIRLVQ